MRRRDFFSGLAGLPFAAAAMAVTPAAVAAPSAIDMFRQSIFGDGEPIRGVFARNVGFKHFVDLESEATKVEIMGINKVVGVSAFQNDLTPSYLERLDALGQEHCRTGRPLWNMSRSLADHLAALRLQNSTREPDLLSVYPDMSRPTPYWRAKPVYVRDDGDGSRDPFLVALLCGGYAYTFSAYGGEPA